MGLRRDVRQTVARDQRLVAHWIRRLHGEIQASALLIPGPSAVGRQWPTAGIHFDSIVLPDRVPADDVEVGNGLTRDAVLEAAVEASIPKDPAIVRDHLQSGDRTMLPGLNGRFDGPLPGNGIQPFKWSPVTIQFDEGVAHREKISFRFGQIGPVNRL